MSEITNDSLESKQPAEFVQLIETSGLEVTKRNQITELLGSFFAKAAEWNSTIESLVITDPNDTGKMKVAREGRLTLRGYRLDGEKVIKQKRDEVKFRMNNDVLEDKLLLKAGQIMELTFKNLETKLEEKEKFREIWEAKERERVKAERLEEILPYQEFIPSTIDFGALSLEDYNKILGSAKAAKVQKELDDQKQREAYAEYERKEALKAERGEKIKPYYQFINLDLHIIPDLGEVSEDDFAKLIAEFAKLKKAKEDEDEKLRKDNELMQIKQHRIASLATIGVAYTGEHFTLEGTTYFSEQVFLLTNDEFKSFIETVLEQIEKIKNEKKHLEEELAARKNRRNEELKPYIVFIRDYNGMLEMSDEDYEQEFHNIKKGAELQWESDRQKMIKEQAENEERERLAEIEERATRELEERKAIRTERLTSIGLSFNGVSFSFKGNKSENVAMNVVLPLNVAISMPEEDFTYLSNEYEADIKSINQYASELANKEKEALQAEKDKAAKLQKEIDDKKAADKLKADAEKKAAKAPDKEKLLAFSKSIVDITKPELQSDEAKEILSKAINLLWKVELYITEKANNI